MTQPFADDPQAIAGAKIVRKGIVRAYDIVTHKADVQLVGSHPTLIPAVRMATDIPAADVVVGRQCTVLFLDPSNQDDAVVITIQGALPSGGGGGASTFIGLTDTPASYSGQALKELRVNAATNAVEFVDQYAYAHTYAALQAFSLGIKIPDGQAIKGSDGVGRIFPFDGDFTTKIDACLRVGGANMPYGAIGINTDPWGGETLMNALLPATATLAINDPIWYRANVAGAVNISGHAIIFEGGPSVGFTGGGILDGMSFTPTASAFAGTTVTRVSAIGGRPGATGAGAFSLMIGCYLPPPYCASGAVIADMAGVDIGDYGYSGAAVATSLRIANITAGTLKYLINAFGLTSYNLRAEAGDPAANQTQVLIAVNNGAVVLRRVEIGAAESGGAGYRMLRVLN